MPEAVLDLTEVDVAKWKTPKPIFRQCITTSACTAEYDSGNNTPAYRVA
jgi:hypothetical protein